MLYPEQGVMLEVEWDRLLAVAVARGYKHARAARVGAAIVGRPHDRETLYGEDVVLDALDRRAEVGMRIAAIAAGDLDP